MQQVCSITCHHLSHAADSCRPLVRHACWPLGYERFRFNGGLSALCLQPYCCRTQGCQKWLCCL